MENTYLDMRKIKQLYRLYTQGVSKRKMSSQLGISRNTVRKYMGILVKSKLTSEEIDKLNFEDCMQDIDLDVWDCIAVYSICEETMLMQSKEYAVYDMDGEGFFCMTVDYSHTMFLPIYPAFNIWVLKGWDLLIKIDPFLRKKDDLICINIIGNNAIQVQTIFENLSAGIFSDALKSRILFPPNDCSSSPKALYPFFDHHSFKDNSITIANQMEAVYVLYGKKACRLYDESFEKLFRSKKIDFDVQKYVEDDNIRVLSKTKQWGDSRKIPIVEYGLLLSREW